ncbi:putative ribonuclease H-like domain-containing protein [Tanacetum coccineum]|uniref:Ribonuclease H-like domain-containing protein n=1 Tax=Tanacetum coccineum TaxID=301880 RepID=A0ABQ5FLA7_9ASTR
MTHEPNLNQCKAVFAKDDAPIDDTSSNETNKHHGVSFIVDHVQVAHKEDVVPSGVMPCQLPPKELNRRSFTLPCNIGSLNLYAMADLGASVNIMPKSMFEHLKLANLKKTDMLVEMDDMTKKALIGIVENVLVKIDKFLFPLDFVVIDMLKMHNGTMILGTFNKKARIMKPEANMPNMHFCRPVKQECDGTFKDSRYGEWCDDNSIPRLHGGTLAQEDVATQQHKKDESRPKPRGYSFKEWLLIKVEHTNCSIGKALGCYRSLGE